jgi:DNA-nicking Smr family endonuclease
MSKIRIDLHPIFNKGLEVESEINRAFDKAEKERIPVIEIISGKGSSELKKRVMLILSKKINKSRYYRLEIDGDNIGRIFVHIRHKNSSKYHG